MLFDETDTTAVLSSHGRGSTCRPDNVWSAQSSFLILVPLAVTSKSTPIRCLRDQSPQVGLYRNSS